MKKFYMGFDEKVAMVTSSPVAVIRAQHNWEQRRPPFNITRSHIWAPGDTAVSQLRVLKLVASSA